jgi:two-component system sensor histidine kinase PilS (NtrC family)
VTRAGGPGRGAVEALATRLIAIGCLFALAVLLEVGGQVPYSERQLTALYAVVLAGFLSTLAFGLVAAYGRPHGIGLELLQLGADGVLISALVYCTGGARSLFGFVYIVWIVHGALRVGSLGAMITPAAAILAFGAVSWGLASGWLPELQPAEHATPREALATLGSHAVAFVLVAALAGRLARDIKRGQRELHELGEIHRRIFDNVSSGLLTVTDDSLVTSFNREAERITGLTAREVVGRPLAVCLPELGEVLAGGGVGAKELAAEDSPRRSLSFRSRSGESLHLGLSLSVLRDAAGEPEGSVVIFQDLTRLVEIEDELRRSERLAAVGQLAAGLAHEIRNPLASLSGAIQLLEPELPELGARFPRLFGIVRRETERLDRLVSQFLDYARPGRLRRECCPLAAVLEEIAELLASSQHHAIELDLELGPALEVEGDPDALRQVFWNLVLNAVEAEPRDGLVRVRATREGGRVRVEVEDRGAGIDPEMIDRIFEPFFTTKPKGTGLGLATVHQLVERQGGSLQVTSQIGSGTTVAVLLAAPES